MGKPVNQLTIIKEESYDYQEDVSDDFDRFRAFSPRDTNENFNILSDVDLAENGENILIKTSS